MLIKGIEAIHGKRLAIRLLTLVLLVSCGGSEAGPTQEPPTDLIGSADTVPAFALGEGDGPDAVTFSDLSDVLVLDDGSIVVANRRKPAQLYRFDPSGNLIGTLGRDGEGPGEFRSVSWVQAVGDTIVAYDPVLARITKFSRADETISSIGLPASRFGLGAHWWGIGMLSDGAVLARPLLAFSGSVSEQGRSEWPLARISLDGAPTQITVVPGTEFGPRPGESRSMGVLFGKTTAVDLDRNRIFVTTGDRLGTDEYNVAGNLVRSCGTVTSTRRVSVSDVDALLDLLVNSVGKSDRAAAKREAAALRSNAPVAKEFPAAGDQDDWGIPTSSVVVDDLQRIWIAEYVGPLDAWAYWAVFDPDCEYLGRVRVPATFRMAQFASGIAVGASLSSDMVESVRAYRIEWRERVNANIAN